ncbi:helix-turn-helix domain-containing protein [Oceanobacillus jordanicus]|uniref:Helix-turn-helix transcriptional regulator n=1 Tax=Oceanobacillus jordanicus TaxID=2867266 RepID=A0AAW5B6Q7_9BACI|nr:helix-turn-helix domain-containing protein [Oceanobacillus jordanicus]MCG3418952.1 helix-turn-helix transcriptional regulator [Oceanobacillus jordanicus]
MKINKHPIIQNIEALLHSKITAYKIQQETGINRSTIGRLKSGEIEIVKLSLENALKLSDLWHTHKKSEDLINE